MAVTDAPVYEIRATPATGEGLFTTRALAAGEEVLAIERPVIALPDERHLPEVCEWCFRWPGGGDGRRREEEKSDGEKVGDGAEELMQCRACKVVRYCGKACQTLSWRSHHRLECPIFARLYPRILPGSVRSLLRVLLLYPTPPASITTLVSHFSLFPGHPSFGDIALMARGAHAYSSTALSTAVVLELYCTLLVNTLTLCTATLDPVGLCFDPLVARVNHSCTPNAAVVFDGRRLGLRTLEQIPAGGEVTIAYIDTSFPTRIRQAELQERWFFTCSCTLCTAAPHISTDQYSCTSCGAASAVPPTPPPLVCGRCDAAQPIPPTAEDTAIAIAEKGSLAEVLEQLRALAASRMFPPHHQPIPALVQAAAQRALDSRRWAAAARWMLLAYVAVDPAVHPQRHHPLRVARAFVLARLLIQVAAESSEAVENQPPQKLAEKLTIGTTGEAGGGEGDSGEDGGEDWIAQNDIDLPTACVALLDEALAQVPLSHGAHSGFARAVARAHQELLQDLGSAGVGVGRAEAELVKVQRAVQGML